MTSYSGVLVQSLRFKRSGVWTTITKLNSHIIFLEKTCSCQSDSLLQMLAGRYSRCLQGLMITRWYGYLHFFGLAWLVASRRKTRTLRLLATPFNQGFALTWSPALQSEEATMDELPIQWREGLSTPLVTLKVSRIKPRSSEPLLDVNKWRAISNDPHANMSINVYLFS